MVAIRGLSNYKIQKNDVCAEQNEKENEPKNAVFILVKVQTWKNYTEIAHWSSKNSHDVAEESADIF